MVEADTANTSATIDVSILIPAQDEAANLGPLLAEIVAVLDGEAFEIVVVDDASTDGTAATVERARQGDHRIRLLSNDVAAGKSGALWRAAHAARGSLAVTVDGDGQNDPKFLPPLLALLRSDPAIGVVCGQRLRRGDGWVKKQVSRIANAVRRRVLSDDTWDTACGLKAVRLEAFLALPYFATLHRFLPALMSADGWRTAHLEVVDRERQHGQSKYGVWDRLAVGIPDLFGVWWLIRRRRRMSEVTTREVG